MAANHAAHAKHRKDLKQAQMDLAEFESMKARIIALEARIRGNTEVQEATLDAEKQIQALLREVANEKRRADGNYRVLTSVEASLASMQVYNRELVQAFVLLQAEFFEEVGRTPTVKRPLKEGAREVMDE
jgi:hypothetical protein